MYVYYDMGFGASALDVKDFGVKVRCGCVGQLEPRLATYDVVKLGPHHSDAFQSIIGIWLVKYLFIRLFFTASHRRYIPRRAADFSPLRPLQLTVTLTLLIFACDFSLPLMVSSFTTTPSVFSFMPGASLDSVAVAFLS
ncbi:hypothetical protein DFS33DRAFT_933266 [Desarmillaria ectypa]|nr:hypothetical protein DFS33DRAFT_933266 [Desarmillaria ectypa]